jgi:hypothetical protein
VCVFATRWFVPWCTRLRHCNSIILCNHYQLHSFHLIVRLHPVPSHLHCQEIVSLLFQCKTRVITSRYTNTHGFSDFLSFLTEEKAMKKSRQKTTGTASSAFLIPIAVSPKMNFRTYGKRRFDSHPSSAIHYFSCEQQNQNHETTSLRLP